MSGQDSMSRYASRGGLNPALPGLLRENSEHGSESSPVISPITAAKRVRRKSLFEDIASVDYSEGATNFFPPEKAASLKAIPRPAVGNLFGAEVGKKVHVESSGEESDDGVEIDLRKRFISLWWRAAFSPFIWSKKEKVKSWGMRTVAKQRAREQKEWQSEQDQISPSTRSLFATSQSAFATQSLAEPRVDYLGKTLSCVSFSERVLMQDASDESSSLPINQSSRLSMSMGNERDGWAKNLPKSGLAWLDRTSTLANGWEGRAVCHKAWVLRASRAREKLLARLEDEVANVVGKDLLRHTRGTRRDGRMRKKLKGFAVYAPVHPRRLPSILSSTATLQSIKHLRSPVSPDILYDKEAHGDFLSSFTLSCYAERPVSTMSSLEEVSETHANQLQSRIQLAEEAIAECEKELSVAWKEYSGGQRKLTHARISLAKIETLLEQRKQLAERKRVLDEENLEEIKRLFMSDVSPEERDRAARVILRFIRRKRNKNSRETEMVTLESGEQRAKITWDHFDFKQLLKPPVDDLSNIVQEIEPEEDPSMVQEMEDHLHQLHLFKGDHESPIHYRYWQLAKALMEERDMTVKAEMMYRAVDNATVETMRQWTLSNHTRALESLEGVRQSMAQAVIYSERLKSKSTKAAIRVGDERRWKAMTNLEKCLGADQGPVLPPDFSHPESPLASPIARGEFQVDSIWSRQSTGSNRSSLFTSLAKHRLGMSGMPQNLRLDDTGDSVRQDNMRSFTQTVVFS